MVSTSNVGSLNRAGAGMDKPESPEAAANKALSRQLCSFHNTGAGKAQAIEYLH
jgi:hypothetical protein